MQPFIVLLSFLFLAVGVYAQPTTNSGLRVIDVDKALGPVNMAASSKYIFPQDKYVRVVEGTPFFKDGWMKSNYIHPVLKTNVVMRLDLVANEVHFRDEADEILIATTPIKQLLLVDTVSNVQYHFIHSSLLDVDKNRADGWYQQLISGKASLYKHYIKQVTETLPYGQATHEQKIKTIPHYYVLVDGEMKKISKIKDLENVLQDRANDVASLIRENGLKGKEDADYMAVVTLYNRLRK